MFHLNSIDPIYWGKSGWIFINSIALTYEPKNKEAYKQFILQLPLILPCRTCGENLKKNINTLDIALESKETFINWLINVRNGIYMDNNTIWKQKNIKETFEEIFNSNSNLNNFNYNKYLWLLFLIIVIILLLYLLKLSKEN